MDTNLPRLQQFDGYGNRVDKLHLAEGWRDAHRTASQEGLVLSHSSILMPYTNNECVLLCCSVICYAIVFIDCIGI
jgi:hypothetical protein